MINSEVKLKYDILCEIMESQIPMGASLLALSIDTSQATIGRQLQQLEHSGYLKKLSNKGRAITDKGKEYLKYLEKELSRSEKIQQLIESSRSFSKERMLDVLKTRKILEKETAILTAKNIKEEQIDELKELINLQETKVSQGLLGDEEDLKIHRLIAHIAGNKVIEQILNLILTQESVYSEFSYIRQKLLTSTVTDHKNIIQALEDRNAELAGNLMENHINKVIEDVINYFNKKRE